VDGCTLCTDRYTRHEVMSRAAKACYSVCWHTVDQTHDTAASVLAGVMSRAAKACYSVCWHVVDQTLDTAASVVTDALGV
jgi:hypothetical protein